MNGHSTNDFDPTEEEYRRAQDDEEPADDEPYPYSFDEWNAIRMNTGRNLVTWSEYVTGYLAEHGHRMDELYRPALVYFGAVDALEDGE